MSKDVTAESSISLCFVLLLYLPPLVPCLCFVGKIKFSTHHVSFETSCQVKVSPRGLMVFSRIQYDRAPNSFNKVLAYFHPKHIL